MNTTTFVNLAADPAAAVADAVFPTLQVLGATVCAGLATVLVWGWPRKAGDLPPGPAPAFFVGNRNQVPRVKPWRWFQELNAQYGDVVFLQMGQTPTIVLGSAQAAWDLLEKRSHIYSSRPRFVMANELMADGMSGLMAPYGEFWRRWRKALHAGFMSKAAESYKPTQTLESTQLMHELLTSPLDFATHLERYAASVVVSVTYGRRVLDVHSDREVVVNRAAMEFFTLINIPGKYLVESFPVLKALPAWAAPWKRMALEGRERGRGYLYTLVQEVREKMERGEANECFAKQLLEQQASGKLDITDSEVAWACGTPFGAGVETTSGTLLCFLLACAEFGPSFLPEAQAELDRVVGRERLPTFEDEEELPFVRAVVKETLRWRPIAVLGGTPHAVTEEDHYKGFRIPKGSTIIAPLWGIHLNPDDFPNPHTFSPHRFLPESLPASYPGKDGHSAFGWGRRICPGKHLAEQSLFLNIARILWAFDVSKAVDPVSGEDVPVDLLAFTDGFNSMPLPFECRIEVRGGGRAGVVEREWEEAQEGLRALE